METARGRFTNVGLANGAFQPPLRLRRSPVAYALAA